MMTTNEIYRSIKAQINMVNQNNILLKDCVFIIGCDVIRTLFNRNIPFDIEVKDITIYGVQCWISTTDPDKCELYIPLEVRNVEGNID